MRCFWVLLFALKAQVAFANPEYFQDCPTCPEVTIIPAGSFQMGNASSPEASPVHTVEIGRFAIGTTEVTNGEWNVCVSDGFCEALFYVRQENSHSSLPATGLRWDQAQDFIRYMNSKVTGEPYRLPSEAEFEYATRAGSNGNFSWGDEFEEGRVNCGTGCNDQYPRFSPALSFPPNGFGLFDMDGNASEWLEDCWHNSYFRAPVDGSAWVGGPGANCEQRVMRGGSGDSGSHHAQVWIRGRDAVGFSSPGVGMRIARDLD